MGPFSSLSSSSSRHGSSRKNSSDQDSSAPAPGAVAAPPAVTGVQSEPQLMENYVTWEPASWDVVLDHYRVIGTDPNGVDVLLGKTIFPFFRRSRRDVAGESGLIMSRWLMLPVLSPLLLARRRLPPCLRSLLVKR